MFHQLLTHPLLKISAILLGSLTCAVAQTDPAPSEEKESKPQLRFICVSSLSEDQETILASRDKEGNWREHGTFKLRSSFISGWMPAHSGELHLALRGAGELKSICHFTCPEGTKRVLVVLLPDTAKTTYHADVINPGKLKFIRGSTLMVNYSPLPGAVVLGSVKTRIKSGERLIVKPQPDANGMYRMMVAYSDPAKKLVPCYDRYVSSNKEARDIIFLLPDRVLGLKVFSLSEFGPFD
jgi:hypothetical protein